MRTSKTASTITNPRSEPNGIHNLQPSGSKNDKSSGVRASNIENSDTENEGDHPLRASDMRELRNPARPLCQNVPNLDETIISEGGSEEEDYHTISIMPADVDIMRKPDHEKKNRFQDLNKKSKIQKNL